MQVRPMPVGRPEPTCLSMPIALQAASSWPCSRSTALDAPDRLGKGAGTCPIPVVILARLAVSMIDRSRGLVVGLLQDKIRRTLVGLENTGCGK